MGNFVIYVLKHKSLGTSSTKVWNELTENMEMFTCKVDSVAKGGQKINEVALVESFYSVNYVNVNYSINYSVKYSTVDCKYLLLLHFFFF